MKNKFETIDIGLLTSYLEIEVTQKVENPTKSKELCIKDLGTKWHVRM